MQNIVQKKMECKPLLSFKVKNKFANVVKTLRGKKTYREFAEMIGVSHPTIKAWEEGIHQPKKKAVERIAALRGETYQEFMAYLEDSSPQDYELCEPNSGINLEDIPFEMIVLRVQTMPLHELRTIISVSMSRFISLTSNY